MFEIKKIRLFELEDFVKSKIYRELDVVPITSSRAKSYLQNPRAQSDDVVLYLGFINNKLVAFRSLFADSAFVGKGSIHFAWCSGSWVRTGFRRKGHSQQLLNEAFSDWNEKLMFTNYAPESEKLYLKTGWFNPVHKFDGARCYLFPKTRRLINASNKNVFTRFIFSIIDFLIKVYSFFKVSFFKLKINPDFRFEELTLPDGECYEWTQQNSSNFLFKRGSQELKWIFENPWISMNNKKFDVKYPFSSISKVFYYRTVKIFTSDKFTGYFIFSVREGHLKTLYFQLKNGIEKEVADYLRKYCIENKLEMATIYNSNVAAHLFRQKFPFLRVKKIGQKIYSTFEVPGEYNFQDGDGDVFFT